METIDYNTSITRVYTFERFLQILVDSSLSFVLPSLWEDPWEAVIFNNENSKWSDKLEITLWGSCWTLNSESDFAWKAYSPNKNGIMVKSTIAKIQAAAEPNCKPSRLIHGIVELATVGQYLN